MFGVFEDVAKGEAEDGGVLNLVKVEQEGNLKSRDLFQLTNGYVEIGLRHQFILRLWIDASINIKKSTKADECDDQF